MSILAGCFLAVMSGSAFSADRQKSREPEDGHRFSVVFEKGSLLNNLKRIVNKFGVGELYIEGPELNVREAAVLNDVSFSELMSYVSEEYGYLVCHDGHTVSLVESNISDRDHPLSTDYYFEHMLDDPGFVNGLEFIASSEEHVSTSTPQIVGRKSLDSILKDKPVDILPTQPLVAFGVADEERYQEQPYNDVDDLPDVVYTVVDEITKVTVLTDPGETTQGVVMMTEPEKDVQVFLREHESSGDTNGWAEKKENPAFVQSGSPKIADGGSIVEQKLTRDVNEVFVRVVAPAETQAGTVVKTFVGPTAETFCSSTFDGVEVASLDEHQAYGFRVKEGSLKMAIEAVVSEFYPHIKKINYKIKPVHEIYVQDCLVESSPRALIQRLIEGYSIPSKIYAGEHVNPVFSVFYEGDPEFNQHMRNKKG